VRPGYVWLVCGIAVVALDALTGIALRHALVRRDALESLSYVLFFVAGIGGGPLEVSGRARRALRAGCLAGGITGLVHSFAGPMFSRLFGFSAPYPVFLGVIAILTAATMGLLGGIVGWGVRKAAEP
jgi:hypothetical protein